MNKTRIAILVVLLGVAALAGIAWYSSRFFDLFYQGSEYSFPKEVVASKPSPSGKYVAKILYDKGTRNYFFAIEGSDGTQLILDRKFVPSAGYHDPIINVSWNGTDTVKIVVDRDFGDRNLVFVFNMKNLSFKQKL